MASPTQWTWVWAISGSWWWTGRPGVLQSLGSQIVRHDWTTELNWTELNYGFWQEQNCFQAKYRASLVAQMVKKKKKKKICLQCRRPKFDPWVRKFPWRREWLPTPGPWSNSSSEKKDSLGTTGSPVYLVIKDLGKIHSSLLDHKLVIQGKIHYFVKESEEKCGLREMRILYVSSWKFEECDLWDKWIYSSEV